MKKNFLLKSFSTLAIASLLLVNFTPRAYSQGEATNDLDTRYSQRGLEVIEVKISDQTVLSGGNIQAHVELVAKSALTYGWSATIKHGTVTGSAIEKFLNVTTVSIPMVGKRTLDLGMITFSPDAQLVFKFDKFGVYQNEGLYIGTFDLATAITLFSGFGYLATNQKEFEDGCINAALGVVTLLQNAGFDGVALVAQLSRGDFSGAFQTLGNMMTAIPDVFSNFLLDQYDIEVAASTISGLGNTLAKGLPVVNVLPMLYDLAQKPGEAEADILGISQATSNVDVVFTIDSSPSMYPDCYCYPDNPDGEDRIGAAKLAAKTFVDQMQTGDNVGVVSFGGYAVTYYPLTAVTHDTQEAAKSGIESIYSINATSIGAGLQAALGQYQQNANTGNPHSILLISDGYENTSPSASSVIPGLQSNNISVYSIGLGDTADASLLQSIATSTGGAYTFSPTPADLAAIYSRLAGQISGLQTVISGEASIAPGETSLKSALIGTRSVTFAVTWDNLAVDVGFQLLSPSGTIIGPSTPATDPSVVFVKTMGFAFYRITAPETGTWQMLTTSPSGTSGDLHYTYTASESTDLKMDAYANSNQIQPGQPVTIYAMLYDNQGLISGANVTATVQPTGDLMAFHDDGTNGDAVAGDGVYTGIYQNTGTVGNYRFLVNASRVDFTRQFEVTVIVSTQAIPNADLWVAHNDLPRAASIPGTFTFSMVYGNGGPDSVKGAGISEYLPADFTFVSSSLGAPVNIESDRIDWTIDTLPAYTFNTFTVTVQINPGVPLGKDVTNHIEINAPADITDSNLDNNGSMMTAYLDYSVFLPAIYR